ncbi:helix-turn-helix domain-containing protein [Lactonifactor longoviformis]|uniref:helix-turn-helix domain-containing protein n=1 Tax=Lactonifactor longoviformis TaxID=341220 RepID=UPI00210E84D8|nr:helix-turn-helix transcriptional regulator [Lactonifactor longoviformis]MCQ4669764.1 helix-turn-helix domain-containing protein [Lactonifactor longoviformis]
MKKLRTHDQEKNIIASRLIKLRNLCGYSQRELAEQLQLKDFNVDKNLITRIETNSRYVSDFEIKAFSEFFDISYSYLLDGIPTEEDIKKYPDL